MVRHPLVQEIVKAYERFEKRKRGKADKLDRAEAGKSLSRTENA